MHDLLPIASLPPSTVIRRAATVFVFAIAFLIVFAVLFTVILTIIFAVLFPLSALT